MTPQTYGRTDGQTDGRTDGRTDRNVVSLALQGVYSVTLANKNLAIANKSRVSCTHNTSRAFVDLITP